MFWQHVDLYDYKVWVTIIYEMNRVNLIRNVIIKYSVIYNSPRKAYLVTYTWRYSFGAEHASLRRSVDTLPFTAVIAVKLPSVFRKLVTFSTVSLMSMLVCETAKLNSYSFVNLRGIFMLDKEQLYLMLLLYVIN